MIFSRAWFALMRRNFIYRRRNWIGSLFEIFMPVAFVGILVSIKNAFEDTDGFRAETVPALIPGDNMTFTPLTFADYVTALQAQRQCVADPNSERGFSITGIAADGFNWQVPVVKCDSYACEYHEQDASQFCEHAMVAVAPVRANDSGGAERALDFRDWLYDWYPVLRNEEGTMPFDFEFVQVFDSSQAMDDYVTRSDYGSEGVPKIAMGVVWEGNDTKNYVYWLRQNSTNFNSPENAGRPVWTTPDTSRSLDSFARNDFEVCTLLDSAPKLGPLGRSCTGQYVYNGILTFQRLVGDYILNRTRAAENGYNVAEAGVQFVQFPTRPYEDSGFYASIEGVGPLLVTLGILYPVAAMIGYITREKELRQKELMKMMSVRESDINQAWFSTFFLFNLITTILTTLVSTQLYENSKFIYLWVFWFFTFLALTVFAMLVSTFTSKSSRAVLIGLLVFFIGVFFTIAIPIDYREDEGLVQLLSLHPVAAFSYGLQEIGRVEDQGTGLQSNTIDFTESPSGYTYTRTINILIFDCIFWGIVTWYLNRVVKPDYGQAEPLWFPFLISYWFPSWVEPKVQCQVVEDNNSNDEAIPFEPVGDTLKRQTRDGNSIELHRLRKVFGDKTAVDGLTLSIYSNQITALLGHNGAGKTTTINMLTGAIAPTDGHATILGKDIRTQLPRIRQDIGVCLQHDCLFPLLTVREHVQFFSRLKGLYSRLPRKEAEAHVDQAIQDVALSEKRSTLSKNLSGGMKRKLSVAMAFCGGSKVVLLDEPTSGMDPFSRRFTWNVIRQYRQNRCIILTTHYMDEADILGDRIAIMADSYLRCVGSSIFLKRYYGVGYQLTIEKHKDGEILDVSSDDADKSNGGAENGVKLLSATNDHKERTRKSVDPPDTFEDSADNVDGDDETCDAPEEACSRLLGNIIKNAFESDKLNGEETGETKNQPLDEPEEVFQIPLSTVAQDDADSAKPQCESVMVIGELDDKRLEEIVQSAVPEASVLSNVGSEMSFQLPMGSSAKFPPMFASLDTLAECGKISSYGVSITTLEEVFLLVARGDTKEYQKATTGVCSDISSGNNSQHARMQLETDGLYKRHLRALFMKRAAFFRRDKKAWLCTTVLPSLFVLIGFIIFKFAVPDRDMDPLRLDLNDYNVKSPEPRNPIAFNRPDNPFVCQPGLCSYQQPVVYEPSTNEYYFFCGVLARMVDMYNCSVFSSSSIMDKVVDAGAVAQPSAVETIYDSSVSLTASSSEYAATQYGAILFTHDAFSQIDNNQSSTYFSAVRETCLSRNVNYTMQDTCNRFGGVGYVIQYNFTAIHSAPMYQALADEALVREANDDTSYKIECSIAPFPITKVEQGFGEAEDAFSAWFLVVLSFPFITAAYGSFVVTERESKAKHLQAVAGVRPSSYWLSTFFWDILNYQIPLWIVVMLMFAFDVNVLTTNDRNVFSGVLLLLILYGPASASFTYCISFLFTSPGVCGMFVIIFGFLIGMGGPMTCFILTLLGNDPAGEKQNFLTAVKVITWILRFTPSFCLGNGLFRSINIFLYLFLDGDLEASAWSEPILLYDVIFLAWQGIVYLWLAMQIDRFYTNPHAVAMWKKFLSVITFRYLWDKADQSDYEISIALPEDSDVIREQERVLSGDADEDLIIVKQLTKVYDTGKVAVNNLNLAIPPGECFGLLGINGAGKTTTLAMLTAEFPPTSGDATLAGFSVTHHPEATRRRIGYCPQFDAHFSNLTGREHVELYASIKGVPKHFVKDAAAAKLEEVGLSAFDSDRLSSNYSGGMKRRLSLACATIGQPQLVFLDEPSTGVDPVARREIWQLISNMVGGDDLPKEERSSVVLTTHSMEECEALCPRIGIMANGRLRCLGSAQHLKHKFGQGYQIEMKVRVMSREDDDFAANKTALARTKENDLLEEEAAVVSDNIAFDLDETVKALITLTGDSSLSDMITVDNPIGYNILKDASSDLGVDLDTLTAFATTEIRMKMLGVFMTERYPNHALRERQDNKCRYEVSSHGVRISSIFASIEAKKDELRLADYGVSQTSLEQVFNFHAAEAERLKQGHYDR